MIPQQEGAFVVRARLPYLCYETGERSLRKCSVEQSNRKSSPEAPSAFTGFPVATASVFAPVYLGIVSEVKEGRGEALADDQCRAVDKEMFTKILEKPRLLANIPGIPCRVPRGQKIPVISLRVFYQERYSQGKPIGIFSGVNRKLTETGIKICEVLGENIRTFRKVVGTAADCARSARGNKSFFHIPYGNGRGRAKCVNFLLHPFTETSLLFLALFRLAGGGLFLFLFHSSLLLSVPFELSCNFFFSFPALLLLFPWHAGWLTRARIEVARRNSLRGVVHAEHVHCRPRDQARTRSFVPSASFPLLLLP